MAPATTFPSPSGRQETGPHAGRWAHGVAGYQGSARQGGRSSQRVSDSLGATGLSRPTHRARGSLQPCAIPATSLCALELAADPLSLLGVLSVKRGHGQQPPSRPTVSIPGRKSHSGLTSGPGRWHPSPVSHSSLDACERSHRPACLFPSFVLRPASGVDRKAWLTSKVTLPRGLSRLCKARSPGQAT